MANARTKKTYCTLNWNYHFTQYEYKSTLYEYVIATAKNEVQ